MKYDQNFFQNKIGDSSLCLSAPLNHIFGLVCGIGTIIKMGAHEGNQGALLCAANMQLTYFSGS